MKVDYPQEIQQMIAHLKRLPGVGPRSAERIGIWLLQSTGSVAEDTAHAILAARDNVSACAECGFFKLLDLNVQSALIPSVIRPWSAL